MTDYGETMPKNITPETKTELLFPNSIGRRLDLRHVEINQPLALEDWQLIFVQNGNVFILNLYLDVNPFYCTSYQSLYSLSS